MSKYLVTRVDKQTLTVRLPVEAARHIDADYRDKLLLYSDGSSLYLTLEEERCILCGSRKALSIYRGLSVCQRCCDKL